MATGLLTGVMNAAPTIAAKSNRAPDPWELPGGQAWLQSVRPMRYMSIYFSPLHECWRLRMFWNLDDASSHLLVWALSPLELACMLSFVASSYGRYLLDQASVLVMSAVTRLP
jgi:hypothetical protein